MDFQDISRDCPGDRWSRGQAVYKFIQSLEPVVHAELERIAEERGISLQELIRAVVIPEWIRTFNSGHIAGRLTPSRRKQS